MLSTLQDLYHLRNSCKYPHLYTNEDGTIIYNSNTNKFLSFYCHKATGYMQCTGGYWVHRVVAESYCHKSHNLLEVNHIDGNKHNNHYTNLEWVTHSENQKHQFRILHHPPPRLGSHLSVEDKQRISKMNTGKNNPAAKTRKIVFNDGDVHVVHTRQEFISLLEHKLGRRYSLSTIKNILSSKTTQARFGINEILVM